MRSSRIRFAAPEALVKDFANARLVTLNRERALNALSPQMLQVLCTAYMDNPHANAQAIYVVRGAGTKSFCAGGDLMNLTVTGTQESIAEFYYKEYQLDHLISGMSRAQVALWDGFVMGSGVGLSIHGRYRVASEKTLFAMPETSIGAVPDIASSYFFPRVPIPGYGVYVDLASARVHGADTVHAGLATHFVPSASIPQLEEQLCNIADPLTASDCLASFAAKELPPFSLEPHLPLLERAFALTDSTTVEGILDALKSDGSEFALATARTMEACSPTALKVSLELLKRGSKLASVTEAFSMEYTVVSHFEELVDFKEGVRALLVDKTKDPKWSPATLAEVSDEAIAAFFTQVKWQKWHPTSPRA